MRRILVLVICLGFGGPGCTKPDPDSCCTSEAQCTSLGIAQLRPCDSARVCNADGACIAPQCTLDSDCTDPASPVCIDQQCTAKCVTDGDCTDPAAAKCDAAGACVACVDNAGCTMAETPVCDGSAHSCRACTADADCDSGVCLEFSGECAATSRLIVVSPNGKDNPTCDAASPCSTVAQGFALVTSARDVIRVAGGAVPLGTATIVLNAANHAVVDGDGSAAIDVGSGSSAAFDVLAGGTLTLEGLKASVEPTSTFVLNEGGVAAINETSLTHGKLIVQEGSFTVTSSQLDSVVFSQTAGVSDLRFNQCTAFSYQFSGGSGSLAANTLDGEDEIVSARSGTIVIENNVITSTDEFADAIDVEQLTAGSTFRFNTMVNTSGADGTARAIKCDATVDVTSNIVAWNSSAPPECVETYTLFDALISENGTGNQNGDVTTFFVDYAHRDFHLSATSPALNHGDPSLTGVTTDYDGKPRPNPAGSAPDVGAFESL